MSGLPTSFRVVPSLAWTSTFLVLLAGETVERPGTPRIKTAELPAAGSPCC